jgi:hypothetical protein
MQEFSLFLIKNNNVNIENCVSDLVIILNYLLPMHGMNNVNFDVESFCDKTNSKEN